MCKAAKADLVFLVDGSWSIGDDNFNKIISFLYSTVGALDKIGPDGTQVTNSKSDRGNGGGEADCGGEWESMSCACVTAYLKLMLDINLLKLIHIISSFFRQYGEADRSSFIAVTFFNMIYVIKFTAQSLKPKAILVPLKSLH